MSVASVFEHEKRMRHVILSSVTFWLHFIFPHHLTNSTIFGKKPF